MIGKKARLYKYIIPKQFVLSEIRERLNERGFRLESTEYKNKHELIEVSCIAHGHKFSRTWDILRRLKECPECKASQPKVLKERVKKTRAVGGKTTNPYTLGDVARSLQEYGYELTSTEYTNCKIPLEMKCSEGHIFRMPFDTWLNAGGECPYCNEGASLTEDIIRVRIAKYGFKLISANSPINRTSILIVECGKGHKINTTWANLNNTKFSCKECSRLAQFLTRDQIVEYLAKFNYILVGEYVRSDKTIDTRCPEGHDYFVKWDGFKYGRRCSKCKK